MTDKLFWTENINVGNLQIPRFMAAPLDGVIDSPLRQLIREFCPHELLMTEMRHVAYVAHDKTGRTLKYNSTEQPLAFQFSANRTDFIDISVEKIIERGFKMVNLNAGCPSKIVTKSGSGSALMANIPLLKKILLHFHNDLKERLPMTIKIRAGFKERNAVEVAQVAEDCGVACIMIHPRTASGKFASRLDFDLVKKVKKKVTIPVVFSGNINSFARAKETYELTGVDGFMIGRALWGAPWKMKEIIEASQDKIFTIDVKQALHYAQKHFTLNQQHYGRYGFSIFKKQLPQYIRSIKGAAQWRQKLLTSKTEEEMKEKLNQVCAENS